MSPFPVQLEDHWVPAPGVDPDRAQLMWFMRFGHDPQVTGLVRLGQERLAGLDGLDLVPSEWLHITTLIAGFADEIPADHVDAMTAHAGMLLAATTPITANFGRILYHPRAIMLDASPRDALLPVLTACREATRIGTGHLGTLHRDPWVPHITLAYSNSTRPAGPVIDALGRELPRREITVRSVSLISQAPRQQWTWHLLKDVPLGDAPKSAASFQW